jgi:hypothetical protein|tara:strand:+ start:225 stop:425 length:201 start_codon:yes stop_codon:yes gene_type:complete
MTGKIYKTSKGWYLETKNNHYLPVYPKQKIEDLKIGSKVNYEIVERENGGMAYTETFEIIKYAKIL